MTDGPTRFHPTRLAVAAGAGAAPRQPTAMESPTASVGAAHGSGSTPTAGPLQAQQLPLQTKPTGLTERDANDASLTPQHQRSALRGRRDARSKLITAQLSPSQQAFVERLEERLRRGQAIVSKPAIGVTGDAGDPALSTARCIGERSTQGERQTDPGLFAHRSESAHCSSRGGSRRRSADE